MISAEPARLNILVAYPYFRGRIPEQVAGFGDDCRLLIDSGAFTAWKAGNALRLADYCRFVESLPVKPWRYFALDVIGDPAATSRNYQAMLDRGLRPIPVFTRGEDPAELERLYETSDLIGLGGVAGADRAAYSWVKWLLPRIADRRTHILGFTNMDWLKFLRPYSVDSSSWNGFGRYGRVAIYMGHGRIIAMTRADAAKRLRDPALQASLRRLGYSPGDLLQPSAWQGDLALCGQLSATSWVAASLEIGRRLGTHLFLAATTEWQVANLRAGFEALRSAGHPAFKRDAPPPAKETAA